MKFPLSCFLVAALSLASARASEEPASPPPKPSLFHRLLHPFGGGGERRAGKAEGNLRQLQLTMLVDPTRPSLSENRQIKVALTLVNKGKKLVQLEFPTSQRIEVLIKNAAGQRVEQWSEDQAFTNEPTLVTINPGERLEYAVSVSTRDLIAGQPYVIEAFFPNFSALRQSSSITPEK